MGKKIIEVTRFDTQGFGGRGTVTRTEEGFLNIYAPVAKEGIYTYQLGGGKVRREYVPKETLFNEDSMKTLRLKPVTNKHPKEILLDCKNVKRRKVGSVGDTVKPENEFLMASFSVTDSDAVEDIEKGRKQLSPGYKVTLKMEEGTWEGQKYDAVQIDRKYNHLALCDSARGGSEIRINIDHLDGEDAIQIENKNNDSKKGVKTMPFLNIDGIDYEAAQEVINWARKQESRADEAEKQLSQTQAKLDSSGEDIQKTTAERDTYKAQVEELQKIDHSKEINKGVKERTELISMAKETFKKDECPKLDEMDNKAIKAAIIGKRLPDYNLDEQNIDVAFDIVKASNIKATKADNSQMQLGVQRNDGGSGLSDVDQVKKDSEDRMLNAWRNLGK